MVSRENSGVFKGNLPAPLPKPLHTPEIPLHRSSSIPHSSGPMDPAALPPPVDMSAVRQPFGSNSRSMTFTVNQAPGPAGASALSASSGTRQFSDPPPPPPSFNAKAAAAGFQKHNTTTATQPTLLSPDIDKKKKEKSSRVFRKKEKGEKKPVKEKKEDGKKKGGMIRNKSFQFSSKKEPEKEEDEVKRNTSFASPPRRDSDEESAQKKGHQRNASAGRIAMVISHAKQTMFQDEQLPVIITAPIFFLAK